MQAGQLKCKFSRQLGCLYIFSSLFLPCKAFIIHNTKTVQIYENYCYFCYIDKKIIDILFAFFDNFRNKVEDGTLTCEPFTCKITIFFQQCKT